MKIKNIVNVVLIIFLIQKSAFASSDEQKAYDQKIKDIDYDSILKFAKLKLPKLEIERRAYLKKLVAKIKAIKITEEE